MEFFDVAAYFEDRNIDYSTEGENTTRGWVNIQCPFPLCGDNLNHCGINLTTKMFSCWKCGEKGTIVKLIQQLEDCSWSKAKRITEHEFQDITNANFIPQEIKNAEKLILPPTITTDFKEVHYDFLRERRFEPKRVIEKYKLMSGGFHGPWRYRLIIPYFYYNEMVTFIGRDILGLLDAKYKNFNIDLSIFDAKKMIYNIDSLKGNKALVVEGCFDAWRIGKNVVSTSGTKFTREQVNLLFDKGIELLYVVYDGEPEAIQQAYSIAELAAGVIKRVEVIELDEGMDPCDLGREDINILRRLVK